MNPVNLRLLGLLGGLATLFAAAPPQSEPRWRVQYFYDQDKSTLIIEDLQFPSSTSGVAVGVIVEGKTRKPVALVTSDAGAHWTKVDLPENPISISFLNESLGWMVTDKGLWVSTELGRNWRRMTKPPAELLRVLFLDEKHGFGIGYKKKVIETRDGGEHWTPVEAAAEPPGEVNFSVYNWIAFPTPRDGIISGLNIPPLRNEQQFPDWMDPEEAMRQRSTPHLSYSLSTRNGGETWSAGATSLFGEISRIRLLPDGNGLGLIAYANSFAYPSEVKQIHWHTGKSETVYRDKKFDVTDIWLLPDGTAYLAGTQVTGQVHDVIPGKVQVLRSTDMSVWAEMPVDYRAVAGRAMLAGSGQNLWMATDAGMILKLEQ
jgi:hypothetical protein